MDGWWMDRWTGRWQGERWRGEEKKEEQRKREREDRIGAQREERMMRVREKVRGRV